MKKKSKFIHTECSDDDVAQDMKLQRADRTKLGGDTHRSLTGRDLLNFAQQIATGMVRILKLLCIRIRRISSICEFHSGQI